MADRNSPQKHVWRSRIVLLTADGLGTVEIMRLTGKSKTAVWRWQERFMADGVDGLLRDKIRPSRIPPLADEIAERVVTRTTTTDPPGEVTHWTAAAMARIIGISVSSIQRIWRAHGLQPHRWRLFKLSNDPQFADGRQHPVFTVEGGGVAIPLAPPWYVDNSTGLCGPVGTGLAPRLIDALLAAPPVEIAEIAAVRGRLAS